MTFLDFSFDPGKVVALVPTLLGLASTVNIARLVKRSKFKASAKRLLFGMSLCEIVSSIAFSAQSLFIPRETSHFLWAIGNGSALGMMQQFSISSFLVSAVISVVYLSKVRCEGREGEDFAKKRIEPWTGALALGYPLVTALIGYGMRVYSVMDFGIDEAARVRQQEISAEIGRFLFPGYPVTSLLAAVCVNSLVIFVFVRGKKLSSQTYPVATAAVLLTYVWTAILRVLESNDIRSNSETGVGSLVLLQAFFLPALGLFNLGTWVRPRFNRVRILYPFESTVWCGLRAMLGERVRPTAGWPEQSPGFDSTSRMRCRF